MEATRVFFPTDAGNSRPDIEDRHGGQTTHGLCTQLPVFGVGSKRRSQEEKHREEEATEDFYFGVEQRIYRRGMLTRLLPCVHLLP